MPLLPSLPSTALRRIASALVSALCLITSGCATAIGAGTVVASCKTPIDHVVSLVSGKDCSIARQQRGLTYCVEDEAPQPARVHCYATIGDPTCFAAPNPFPGNQRKLGSDIERASVSR